MKILSAAQIKELDAYTITNEPIASIDLMERAAIACFNWITERYTTQTPFTVFCGLGNNGGDGLAIARMLSAKNYQVNVFVIRYSDKQSADFDINYARLKNAESDNLKVTEVISATDLIAKSVVAENAVIIDAIIGTGLTNPAKGLAEEVIHFINIKSNTVISIDLPSGLFADDLNDSKDAIVRCTYTLSFQVPKLSFMLPENAVYVGEFSILNIGLNANCLNSLSSDYYLLTKNDIQPLLHRRNRVAHKGVFGHALVIAGSYGKVGAAVLAANACMRSGVGLLTVNVPKCAYEIIQVSLPEAMVISDAEQNFITETIHTEKFDAIGVGSGIGLEKQTQNVLKMLIQNAQTPLVFDADAINIIAENKTWLGFVPRNSIFTPHPKEFERMAGKVENSFERLKLQRDFSIKNNVYVVLKGAHTSISCPNGQVFFNSTGNPGMATGGAGDVLTGIITSLLAQHYSSLHASLLGVYLHGLAGDFAAETKTEECMIAGDIIENLPAAFKFLKAEPV